MTNDDKPPLFCLSPPRLVPCQVVKSADVIFIAVKPQYVSVVLREVRAGHAAGGPTCRLASLRALSGSCSGLLPRSAHLPSAPLVHQVCMRPTIQHRCSSTKSLGHPSRWMPHDACPPPALCFNTTLPPVPTCLVPTCACPVLPHRPMLHL